MVFSNGVKSNSGLPAGKQAKPVSLLKGNGSKAVTQNRKLIPASTARRAGIVTEGRKIVEKAKGAS